MTRASLDDLREVARQLHQRQHHQPDTSGLKPPTGNEDLRWLLNVGRYFHNPDPDYIAAVNRFAGRHFPRRDPDVTTLMVYENDGQLVALAEVRLDPDGDWLRDPRPPHRLRRELVVVLLPEGEVLP